MNIKNIFTANADEWGTPKEFFHILDKEFNFTLDPCGDKNRILKNEIKTFDISDNGLNKSWKNQKVFVNPPYSKENFRRWCEKVYKEKDFADLIVLLCPLRRCSNIYFHNLILQYSELRIVKGRLDFIPLKGQNRAANPSGSALCILRNNKR